MNDFDIDGLKSLLEKVKLINFKYEKILKASEYDFNIFTTLVKKNYDEVNLHSRFLYEILNPDGTHNKGDIFLKLFMETVDISDFVMEHIWLEREYKNIDICITNSRKQAIIIENKIYAEDQYKQIERYYETMEKNGFDDIKIVYLTLYGDDPSSQSLGSLEGNEKLILNTTSYKDDIDNWLEKCIKEAAIFPTLRETFVQYRTLVQKLTGKYHSKEYIMEIRDLLMDEKNIRLATDISQALTEAQIEIQYQFWKELASCLENKNYHIQDESKVSRDNVESYYYKSRDNKYYGITINLHNIDDAEKLQFRIQIDWDDYILYGFRIERDGSDYNIQKESKYGKLADIIKKTNSDFEKNEWWLGWNYTTRDYNFKNFNDDNVFALANSSKREEFVKELADEIHGIIESFKELYHTEM